MLAGSTLAHLQWAELCQKVLDRVVSPAARDRVCNREGELELDAVLPRSTEVTEVADQLLALDGLQTCLREAAGIDEAKVAIGGELGEVEDTSAVLERSARGSALSIVELAAVAEAAIAAGRVATMVGRVAEDGLTRASEGERRAFEHFATRVAPLTPPMDLVEMLERSIDWSQSEPTLSDRASPALAGLRKKAADARRSLVQSAERMLRRPGIDRALSDRYWTERDGRVVLPVRSDAFSRGGGGQGTVSGIIHESSGSGQTLFVEPHELVDGSNALRQAIMGVRAEELRILARLSREVGEGAEGLLASLASLIDLDLLHARLRLCVDLEAHAPTIHASRLGARLELPGARHPLMTLGGVEVVPSDLRLSVGRGLIISGVNAGGKTVALKTLGLCVLMAQAGLRLPTAQPGELPLFRGLVTDVGDDQSIAANLSTFSAHIGHVQDALAAAQADPAGVMVLLDEVAVGTDPDQGAALAEAILRALLDLEASVVVTTHYERLKLLATHDERFTNAAVGFDLENLRPTFELRIGAPGSSSALAVARRLGLPAPIIATAESLMEQAQVRVDALLQEIEAERESLRSDREALQTQQRQLKLDRAALERREQQQESSAAVRRKKAHDAATAALRDIEDELKKRRKAFKRQSPSPDEAGVLDGDMRAQVREVKAKIHEQRLPTTERTAPPPQTVEVGQTVKVPSLSSEGPVVAVKGDKVTVQLPLAKVTVGLGDLEVAPRPAKARRKPAKAVWTPASQVDKHFGADAQRVEARIDNVVDLRGIRAEEAITMVEVFLDRAIADDTEVVIVKHGHGSGALRKVVREHLPRLGHVVRHRPGLPAEGGDAVTIVWVRA